MGFIIKSEVIMKKLLLSLAFFSVLSQFSGLTAQKVPFCRVGSQVLTLEQVQALIALNDPELTPQKPPLPRKPSKEALKAAFQHKPAVPQKPSADALAKAGLKPQLPPKPSLEAMAAFDVKKTFPPKGPELLLKAYKKLQLLQLDARA
jgi:hypothetical protein